jgi:molybdopterin-guanine dinucleotide biosynthesis protein A
VKTNKSEILPVSAVILAGGRGERIGGNKLFLTIDGIFIIESIIEKMSQIFNEILICVGKGESETVQNAFSALFKFYSVILVEDRFHRIGPIEGLYEGLNAMNNAWGFLLGCDMPSPQEAVVRYMWRRTVDLSEEYEVSAANLNGYLMPLHAFYHKNCSYYINSFIERFGSECNVTANDGGLMGSTKRNSCNTFNEKLKLKSFYCCTKVNIIEENELAVIPGWRKSFTSFNTDKELKSVFGF